MKNSRNSFNMPRREYKRYKHMVEFMGRWKYLWECEIIFIKFHSIYQRLTSYIINVEFGESVEVAGLAFGASWLTEEVVR